MTETYTPKVGDRVRVTLEGEVVWENGIWAHIHTMPHSLVSTSLRLRKEEGFVIEKLQDPEPQWVNGDVVLVTTTGGVFVRSGDAWRHAQTNQWSAGSVISNRWVEGNLEILYKADGEDAPKEVLVPEDEFF